MIGRRAFIGSVSLLAAAARGGAWAQQLGRLPRLAIVDPSFPVESIAAGGDPYWDAFLGGLRDLGRVEGQSIIIERWSAAGVMALDDVARQVVSTEPDIIVCSGRFLIEAHGRATTTIPIVGLGTFFGVNYARPGGNVTGIDISGGVIILAKQLELLSASSPAASRVGYVATKESWDGPLGASVRDAAGRLGLTLSEVTVAPPVGEATIRAAFAGLRDGEQDALYIAPLAAFRPYNSLIAALALEHRLPAVTGFREQAEAGLLMSYWPNMRAMFRRGATHYVGSILAGANPGEMAIEQPTVFEFVVNIRTAAVLGLTLPPTILLFATELIE